MITENKKQEAVFILYEETYQKTYKGKKVNVKFQVSFDRYNWIIIDGSNSSFFSSYELFLINLIKLQHKKRMRGLDISQLLQQYQTSERYASAIADMVEEKLSKTRKEIVKYDDYRKEAILLRTRVKNLERKLEESKK